MGLNKSYMKKYYLIFSLLILLFASGNWNKIRGSEPPTNFIIVLVDDLGYGDVGYHGATDMVTPNIDKLASEGMYFTEGYVTSSVCGPSRCGLISGRYQDRLGISGNFTATSPNGFPVDQVMVQDILKENGYTTGAIGKWHFGQEEQFKPWNRNFDFFYGFLAGGHSYYEAEMDYSSPQKDVWPIHRNSDIVDYENGNYLTDEFNKEALGFIDSNHDKPFFLYLAYNAVHYPWDAPDSYLERVDEHHNYDTEYRRILAGMLLAVDDGVGAIMQKLEDYGIDENTAIIFLSDNGSPDNIDGSDQKYVMSSTMGLRGYKGDTYEGGIKVPFAIKWPGVVPAGEKYEKPVISLDIVPTITRFLGIDDPETGYDGVNLIPYLTGENLENPHDYMYFRYMDDYAYRLGDWKITWNDQEKNEFITDDKLELSSIETKLFNVKYDPYEKTDLKDQQPEKEAELQKLFDDMDSKMPDKGLFPVPYNRKQYLGDEHIIEAFEDAPVKSEINKLGSNVEVNVVDNPLKSGINTSDKVLEVHILAENTNNWAGTWFDVADFSRQHNYVHMKVLKTRISPLRFKIEENGNTHTVLSTKDQTLVDEWEDMVFDFSDSDISQIQKVNIQPDYTTDYGEYWIYIDDIVINNNPNPTGTTEFSELVAYGLEVTNKTDTELTLEWGALEGAVAYDVYVNDELSTTTADTHTVLNSLLVDEMYTIYIVARNAADESSQPSSKLTSYMPEYKHIFEDFEQETTSFESFSGSVVSVVDNPLKDGINISDEVMKVDFPADDSRKDWAGITAPNGELNAFSGNLRYLHVKLLKTVTSTVMCKAIGSGEGVGTSITSTIPQSLTGVWEDFVFDITGGDKSISSLQLQLDRTSDRIAHTVYVDDIYLSNDPSPAGLSKFPTTFPYGLSVVEKTETEITLEWGELEDAILYDIYVNGELTATTAVTGVVLSNLENDKEYIIYIVAKNSEDEYSQNSSEITVNMPGYSHVICDFDTKSLNFNVLGNTVLTVTENPDKSGINTSNNVLKIERLEGNTTDWAGTWAEVEQFNYDYDYVHMLVYKEKVSTVRFKSEGGTTETKVSMNTQTKTGEWEDMVFDFRTFNRFDIMANRINIQPDFTTSGEAHIFYIDDIIMSNDPEPRTVSISTDMDEKDAHTTNNLQVYPVPAKLSVYIKNPQKVESDVIIIDYMGKPLINADKESLIDGINVSTLSSGIYFLSCLYNGVQETTKIIIE